jgi:peptidyl-dipeptidase A
MFEEANRFFIDLGLEDMTDSYNTSKAMIVRPNDGREVTCHASAWDFCDGVDYRF